LSTENESTLAGLEAFAREKIAAERYPDDRHVFTPAACPACGVTPLVVTVEPHSGSTKTNFRGVITGRCPRCGSVARILHFTGEHRHKEREERPRCQCGGDEFVVATCERFEGESGLAGFFDEGVVVGACASCGRQRVFALTD